MTRVLSALLLVQACTYAAAAQAAPPTGPGVSLALAEHRAATLSDVRYDLAFRIPASPDSAITGRARIGLVRRGDGPLVLDFARPDRIDSVAVDGRRAAHRGVHDHVVVPMTGPGAGRAEVTLWFTAGDAPLNRRDDFLYTLFVPDRAHEAFPSFDQPDLKARYTLRLTVPAGWEAVANGARIAAEPAEGGVAYRFAETAPLPTYLFAFAAGRFEVEEAVRDGRVMRMLHRETDTTKVARNRAAIFDLHAAALAWLEAYTGIPYPYGKFDFVAVPSFQYHGMEHPGAILYRASSLFLDGSATRNEELGRASVIAHETAHMWFGDLVTMRWFDDVWMKEVFANFMAAKIVNPSFPDLDHDLRFLLAHYPSAYDVDRTAGANPIRQPLENLDDAGSLYGAIIYQKAPIVMRQLETLTGEAAFRTALRRYLADHAFGNASWPDLVAALDAVTPLDVAAWSRVWIGEPGRPTVEVARPDGDVALRQWDPRGRGLLWPQRTGVRALGDDGAADSVVTLDRPAVRIDLPPAARHGAQVVLPNADGMGYGLFLLDDNTVATLLRDLPLIPDALARSAAWLDLWEMMLEGRVDPVRMLDLGIRAVGVETDELAVQQLLGDLRALHWRWLPDEARRAESGRLEQVLWGRMQAVEGASRKAAFFNAWRDIATSPAAVDRMRALWSGDLVVEGLPLSERDRTTLALELAVREAPEWERVLAAQRESIENPDRRDRFDFIRPAVSADPAVRDSFFASLADVASRRREEWVVAALGYLHHPLRARESVRYLRPGLELLSEIRATGDIFFPTRWLAASLGGHRSAEAAAIVLRFIDEHPDYPPRLMGKLLQEADPLFRAAAAAAPRREAVR